MLENRVIIRAWENKFELKKFGPHLKTGHASLQLSHKDGEEYISFWPQGKPANNSLTEIRNGHFSQSFLEDYQLMKGRLPNITIALYSLTSNDINKMKSLFQKLQGCLLADNQASPNSTCNWTMPGVKLPGTHFFKAKPKNDRHNCASLVMTILREGNIDRLAPSSVCSVPIATPNFIISTAIKAKQSELFDEPETQAEKFQYKYIWNLDNQEIIETETVLLTRRPLCQ